VFTPYGVTFRTVNVCAFWFRPQFVQARSPGRSARPGLSVVQRKREIPLRKHQL